MMTGTERKAVLALAGIYALRMMGLFMILPVFALYAENLEGVTPSLIGLAIGIYGLTQAIFQIPYGMLSDKVGRKPVILMGLLIFALGSVVAATADSIFMVIVGRALQGAGAIAATLMALTADLTREENRLVAMAAIGMSIGAAFTISLVLGPVLGNLIGVPGIFWLTAILSIGAMAVLKWVVPDPIKSNFHRDTMTAPQQIKSVLQDTQLLRIDFGIFSLHLLLTASFVVVPLALRDHAGLPSADHWLVYLCVMLVSVLAMVPFVVLAEKKRKLKQVFGAAIMILVIAEVGFMTAYHSLTGMVFSMLLFFVAFNILEATLPSLVAKLAPADRKGTAMGVYSSSQFMGAFVGGVLGGWLYGEYGFEAVFGMCSVVALIWFFLAATMINPRYLSSHMIKVGDMDEKQARHLVAELTAVTGVAEAVVVIDDGIAYLKVDRHALDYSALQQYAQV